MINAPGNAILEVIEFAVEVIVLLLEIFVHFLSLGEGIFLFFLCFAISIVSTGDITQLLQHRLLKSCEELVIFGLLWLSYHLNLRRVGRSFLIFLLEFIQLSQPRPF